MKIGDVVRMKQDHSPPGIIIGFLEEERCTKEIRGKQVLGAQWSWVHVLWSDEGMGLEKTRNLKVISEGM